MFILSNNFGEIEKIKTNTYENKYDFFSSLTNFYFLINLFSISSNNVRLLF